MAELVCGRNVLWPNQSVDEPSRKHIELINHLSKHYVCTAPFQPCAKIHEKW